MLVNPSRILKTVYKGLLLGLPQILFTPLLNSKLLVPLQVDEISTYINYNLEADDIIKLSNYIHRYNSSLSMVPISLLDGEEKDYYLSINIYNATSAVFLTTAPVTRCELNTYVKDKNGNIGTLIIDYITNGQSMDPIALMRFPEFERVCEFIKSDEKCSINCSSKETKLQFNLTFALNNNEKIKLDKELIKYTDNIFYKDGILDKLYYDDSLINAETYGLDDLDFSFKYRELLLSKPRSVFYFKNKLKFVGSMWDNVYQLRRHNPTLRERYALAYISNKKVK